VPAVRRGRDILHEQIIQAIVGNPICEREVQCPLHLPAELPRFPQPLPTGGHGIGGGPGQGLGEIRVHEC
jgi:hypothetical protein